MASEYISALVGAISSIFIGGAVYLGQQRYAKWTAAMNIIAEFNTLEWLGLRNALQEDLTRDPGFSVMASDAPGAGDDVRRLRHQAWALIAFYARLSVMFGGGFLARKPVFATFAEVFAWWYEFWLRYRSELEGTSELDHIRKLKTEFELEANAQHRSRDFVRWRERGRAARAVLGLDCEPLD